MKYKTIAYSTSGLTTELIMVALPSRYEYAKTQYGVALLLAALLVTAGPKPLRPAAGIALVSMIAASALTAQKDPRTVIRGQANNLVDAPIELDDFGR